MPNVMATLPNIGGALCSTPQSLADAGNRQVTLLGMLDLSAAWDQLRAQRSVSSMGSLYLLPSTVLTT